MQPAELIDASDSVRSGRPLALCASGSPSPVRWSWSWGDGFPRSRWSSRPTAGSIGRGATTRCCFRHALSGDSHVRTARPAGRAGLVGDCRRAGQGHRHRSLLRDLPEHPWRLPRHPTGPESLNPQTGRPYGRDFPVITVGDTSRSSRRLVAHLGVARLRAVVGGSVGGHMVLTWATRFPESLAGAVAPATSPRLTSQALAFNVVGRNAILRDPNYCGGQYYGSGPGPLVGLALARMLGHITYLSREAMTQKFDAHRLQPHDIQTQFETKFSVGSYLAYQGDRFGERFDPNSYLTLTMAMDSVRPRRHARRAVRGAGPPRCRWLLVSFTSDWLFPPFQSQKLVTTLLAAGRPVSYCNVLTSCGARRLFAAQRDRHLRRPDGGLPGEPRRLAGPGQRLLNRQRPPAGRRAPRGQPHQHLPPSPPGLRDDSRPGPAGGQRAGPGLRHRRPVRPGSASGDTANCWASRLDEQAIVDCVPPRAGRGPDRPQPGPARPGRPAVQRGRPLADLADGDGRCQRVVRDMLRVGRRAIVSFPNLGYRKLREQLAQEGRAPRASTLQGNRWYEHAQRPFPLHRRLPAVLPRPARSRSTRRSP